MLEINKIYCMDAIEFMKKNKSNTKKIKTVCLKCKNVFEGEWIKTEAIRVPPFCPKCKKDDCEEWSIVETEEILHSPEVMKAIKAYKDRRDVKDERKEQ